MHDGHPEGVSSSTVLHLRIIAMLYPLAPPALLPLPLPVPLPAPPPALLPQALLPQSQFALAQLLSHRTPRVLIFFKVQQPRCSWKWMQGLRPVVALMAALSPRWASRSFSKQRALAAWRFPWKLQICNRRNLALPRIVSFFSATLSFRERR